MHASEFEAVIGDDPSLVRVVDTDAHEGPVYVAAEDAVYYTTVPRREGATPRVAIKRLALDGLRFPLDGERVSVVRADANVANGMCLAADGALLVCEQGTFSTPARISRVDRVTGAAETVADAWEGLPLNSPNDIVRRTDGSIWFTDPIYGHLQGFRPPPRAGDNVYRLDPAGCGLTKAVNGFDKPNGLAFSPGEEILYVADNGVPRHLLAFDVGDGGAVANRRRIAVSAPGHPDGLKVDTEGRIYASAPTGVRVLAPDGALIGEIGLPGAVNFAFGGPDRNVLFITTDTAIWAAVLNAKGA